VQRTAHGKSCLPMRVFKRFRCCPPLLPGCQLGHCRTSDARGNTAAYLVVPHTARQGQHDAAPHRARRRPADIAKLGGHILNRSRSGFGGVSHIFVSMFEQPNVRRTYLGMNEYTFVMKQCHA
ncbi:unnamed protein product, partial [Pylaiella littoralis]